MTLVLKLLRETKVSNLYLKVDLVHVDLSQKLFLLLLAHIQNSLRVVREVKHDVLKFEVSVNHQDVHHVAEASHQLIHDFLYDIRRQFPVLHLHQLFQVVAVTELHKDVEPRVSLDGLLHFGYVQRVHSILVLNF